MYVVISFLHKFHQRTLFHRRIVLEHFDLDQQIHSGSEFRINDETLFRVKISTSVCFSYTLFCVLLFFLVFRFTISALSSFFLFRNTLLSIEINKMHSQL